MTVQIRSNSTSYVPRILIVDDEAHMCDSLKVLLGHQGYEIYTSNSGQEAIERLREDSFDLVLLDVVMPDMDGHQVMQHITCFHRLGWTGPA